MKKLAQKDVLLSDKSASNQTFPFSLSSTRFLSKPTDKDIPNLRFIACTGTLMKLLGLTILGHTFSCGIFQDDNRASRNLLKQQIFCVDFDGEMSLNEAQEILKEHGLWYNAGYYTFNHSEITEKFRLIFVFNGEIHSPQLVKEINLGFHHLFLCKSDKKCTDAARFWIGTNKTYFLGDLDSLINLDNFLEITTPFLLAADGNKWRGITANRKNKCTDSGILIYNHNNNNQKGTVSIKVNSEKIKKIDNHNINELLYFKLFEVFYNGGGTEAKKIKLVHNELVGIASNLIYINGGSTIWKMCLDKNGNYGEEKYSIYNYVKKLNYKPIHFEKFSPYKEDIEGYFQTFPQILVKRGQIKVLSTDNNKPLLLTEARQELHSKFNEILNADDTNVYLLKCATGLGKTELIKNTKNVVIAFPTHSLKDENFLNSKLSDECKLSTPEVAGFTEKTQKHFDALYRNGFNNIVHTLIKDLANGTAINNDRICDKKDIEVANIFLRSLQAVKDSTISNTIFTTQHRAVLSSFPQSTLIFDENPLSVLLSQDVVPVNDFDKLITELFSTGYSELADKLRSCVNSEDKQVRNTPNLKVDEKTIYTAIKKLKIKSKLWGFFNSDYYIKIENKINFCTSNVSLLPSDKKIVIADATAPVNLYKKLFGKRLIVIDISNVQLKGEIIQYTQYSNSKSGLNRYGAITRSCLDNWTLITYKDRKSFFENSSELIHWGNAKGTNSLEGQNLNVVGTLHYGLTYYMFLAKFCELNIENFDMEYNKVIYKNLEFLFPTFKNKELRELHLELVEGDSIQAVHRARPINYNVTVKLYSNMPIPQAKWIWWELNKPSNN